MSSFNGLIGVQNLVLHPVIHDVCQNAPAACLLAYLRPVRGSTAEQLSIVARTSQLRSYRCACSCVNTGPRANLDIVCQLQPLP